MKGSDNSSFCAKCAQVGWIKEESIRCTDRNYNYNYNKRGGGIDKTERWKKEKRDARDDKFLKKRGNF